MEGYYPINEYCRLSGVKRDTAYHRAIRNEIPSFKDANNRLFIYFTDYDASVPEGFVTLREYAAAHNMSQPFVRQHVYLGNFKKEDVFRLERNEFNPKRNYIYIHKDAKIHKKVDLLCPPGYLNAMEWCAKYDISRNNLGQKILHGKITPIKIGNYLYLEDREYEL